MASTCDCCIDKKQKSLDHVLSSGEVAGEDGLEKSNLYYERI